MNLVDSSFHLATFLMLMRVGSLYVKHQAIRIDSIRYANRFESIRFVKKIGLLIH